MVVEQLGNPKDLLEENEDLQKHSPDFAKSTAYRLSFFKRKFANRRGLNSTKDAEFIGYAIVKEDYAPSFGEIRRIYESVIHPSRHDNNFVRGSQVWSCQAGSKQFKIAGYLYAQQNGLTNVCAHAALRTVAARFRDMSYREMNQLLGIDHIKVKIGDGLPVQQMVQVLEKAGAQCFQADYSKPSPNPPPFQKYIYGSIESGYPAIVVFGTADQNDTLHAVPVFGHTFNQDTWVPSADVSYFKVGQGTIYIPSESWLSMFMAHDDNWGSNYCIPRHYLRPKQQPAPGQPAPGQPAPKPEKTVSECIAHVIGTMPKEVKVNPVYAEVIGADYLFTILPQLPAKKNLWAQRLSKYAGARLMVLRPYLLNSTEYTAHLAKVRDWDGEPLRADLISALRANLLKEHLWMIELSVPELFSANLRKVGEVLVRAEVLPAVKRDLGSFILARLPGYFALLAGGSPSNPQYQFIPSGAEGHVELIGCEDKGPG
jgi:hypothetical protein